MTEKQQLFNDLVSSLNGGPEDWADVQRIMQKIRDTQDEDFIAKAEYLCSVV